MDHKEQIANLEKEIEKLIRYHTDEFTELTFAAVIGVLEVTKDKVINWMKESK